MAWVLGVDQGGTKTEVVIADQEGNILAFENDRDFTDWTGERRELRMKRIRYAADKAVRACGIDYGQISAVAASLNGADWPFEYAVGEKNVRRTLGIQDVMHYGDCVGAMRGGIDTHGRNCAVICLGTGTNVAVQAADGRQFVYGYYVKDRHQAGGSIGKSVFEIVLAANIGLERRTIMTEILLKETHFDSVEKLFMSITTGVSEYDKPIRIVYKDYAWIMFEAMRRGDAVATAFVQDFCEGLCGYVLHGAQRFGIGNDLTVVFSGGIVKVCPEIVSICSAYLSARMEGICCVNARYEPVIGAVLYWLDREYDYRIPARVMQRLDAQCAGRGLIRYKE